jgi:hypothetical protein
MTPGKIRLKTVAAKAEAIRTMIAAIETLPLTSEAELSADARMLAAGESFLHTGYCHRKASPNYG